MKKTIFGFSQINIADIWSLAHKQTVAELDRSEAFVNRINSGARFLDEAIAEIGDIYGVTTGYGDSCSKSVPSDHYFTLPIHLTRFHGCGLGDYFDAETTRAILAVRLTSLCRGQSGVSFELLEGIEAFLRHDILPLIPQEGSVGASGDLTPLSYIAGALIGERVVLYQGEKRPSADVMAELGIKPIRLRPKEGLAIMNGTAVMTAVAIMAFERARYLGDLCCRLTSMASIALKGNAYHFDERLASVKPHPGQMQVYARIRNDLGYHSETEVIPERLQDPYSIRCAPHVIGVLFDAIPFFKSLIENELNSSNDNPIIDPDTRSIMHGGHFYGGHIAFAMDSLKNVVANLADLLDRQLAVLVDEKFNRNLPPNLSGSKGEYSFNHGFKAVQIGSSAWTAEALKATMPASVFSRSTECHNQDKVSMGTIAARDCIRVLELTEQVAAACVLAFTQAVNLRNRDETIEASRLIGIQETLDQVNGVFEFLDEDRPLEADLRHIIALIKERYWRLPHDTTIG